MEDFKPAEILEFKKECFGKKCNVDKLNFITLNINNSFNDNMKSFCNLCYWLMKLRNLFNNDDEII